MSSDILSLVMDVLVLIFLGAMIFYSVKLSENLKEFRKQKHSFDGVIADLLSSIDQAERSVHSLKQVSSKETEELAELIRKAKLLSEELKDVNQASESMAKRLEGLAEKNRKSMQGGVFSETKVAQPVYKSYETELKSVPKNTVVQKQELSKKDLPSFMIQDRDFEDLDALGERLEETRSNDTANGAGEHDEGGIPEELQSQAEKELYTALMTSKRNMRDTRGR